MLLKKINSTFILLILSLLFVGCGVQTVQKDHQNKVYPENSENMIQAQNNFAFRLFNNVIKSDIEENNRLISPLSIYMDFAMLYNGASGETKRAMQQALHLKEADPKQLNELQSKLLLDLPKIDSSVTINMANAIWYRKDLTPKPEFLSVNQKYYQAKVEAAEFGNPQTVKDINGWVNQNTQGKIPSIVDEIAAGEVMYLLNAVYFKGEWKDGFTAKLTHDDVFHTSTGEKQLPFMFKDARFNYFKNESLKIAELPYGKGSFSMFVILPSENNDVYQLAESLNPKYFTELISKMSNTSIKLFLPKWEASYSADELKENLSKMGMGIAFKNKADFSELFEEESTKISQIKHKTYIKVDEEGTEAAAATSIGMVTTSMPAPTTEEMKADRPFVYLIVERITGTILFIGTMGDPSKS